MIRFTAAHRKFYAYKEGKMKRIGLLLVLVFSVVVGARAEVEASDTREVGYYVTLSVPGLLRHEGYIPQAGGAITVSEWRTVEHGSSGFIGAKIEVLPCSWENASALRIYGRLTSTLKKGRAEKIESNFSKEDIEQRLTVFSFPVRVHVNGEPKDMTLNVEIEKRRVYGGLAELRSENIVSVFGRVRRPGYVDAWTLREAMSAALLKDENVKRVSILDRMGAVRVFESQTGLKGLPLETPLNVLDEVVIE